MNEGGTAFSTPLTTLVVGGRFCYDRKSGMLVVLIMWSLKSDINKGRETKW